MLTELELCTIPTTEDACITDDAHEFVVTSLAHTQKIDLATRLRHDTYVGLMQCLRFLNQHYAVAMVLIMTGSAKRNRKILRKIQEYLTHCNLLNNMLNNHLPVVDIPQAKQICEMWSGSHEELSHCRINFPLSMIQ